jgi:hypothetical protein
MANAAKRRWFPCNPGWRNRSDGGALIERIGALHYRLKRRRTIMRPASAIIMFALAVGVVVLGVLYYQELNRGLTIKVDPPKVQIK